MLPELSHLHGCALVQPSPPLLVLNPLNPLGLKSRSPVSTNPRAIVIIRVRDVVDLAPVRRSPPVPLPLPGRSADFQLLDIKIDNDFYFISGEVLVHGL